MRTHYRDGRILEIYVDLQALMSHEAQTRVDCREG